MPSKIVTPAVIFSTKLQFSNIGCALLSLIWHPTIVFDSKMQFKKYDEIEDIRAPAPLFCVNLELKIDATVLFDN